MNTIDRYLVKLVLLASPLYAKLSVQQAILKSILITKLIKDDRQSFGFYKNKSGKDSSSPGNTVVSIIISLVFGLSLLISFLFTDDLTRMTFYFSFYMIMMAMLLIIKSANSWIDSSDNYIILPRQVYASTFTLSRLLHILITTLKLAIPMMIPGLIAMLFTRGYWAGIIFLVTTAMVIFFCVMLVACIYLMLIHLLSPARFNILIDAFQIISGISILFMGNIINKLLESSFFNEFSVVYHWKLWLLPSFWFAGTWKFLYTGLFEFVPIISSLLSAGVILFCTWLVVNYFSAVFMKKLFEVSQNSGSFQKSGTLKLTKWIGNHFSINPVERASFFFCWNLISRNRDFKLASYPMLAYMLIGLFLPVLSELSNYLIKGTQFQLSESRVGFIVIIYAATFINTLTMAYLPFSDKFKSAWIFFTTPLEKPGELLAGATKVILCKFYAPLILIIISGSLLIFGIHILPNLLFGFINNLLICYITALFCFNHFPFTVPWKESEKTGFAVMIIIITFIQCIFFSLIHYVVYNKNIVLLCLSAGLSVFSYFVFQSIRNKSWNDFKQEVIKEELSI